MSEKMKTPAEIKAAEKKARVELEVKRLCTHVEVSAHALGQAMVNSDGRHQGLVLDALEIANRALGVFGFALSALPLKT